MSAEVTRRRLRAAAARSPLLRKLAARAALYAPARARQGANASAWTVSERSLWPVAERYAGSFPLPPISYGTVRDLADSSDHMPGMAVTSFDMKDLQRSWTVKAVLGNVPRGSRILEIGAGEPLVAGTLSRLGYEVTVVDPYDGSDKGPREFRRFQQAYPDLTFVRDRFPTAEPLGDGYAAVYSISVLEHVPLDLIETVIGAGRELVDASGGCSIHAVDHVLAGWGAEEYREKLSRIVAALGLSEEELERTLERMREDPDTYLVSAEAHNRWRGDLPYDRYPMRRIGSVNLLAGRPGP